MNCPNCDKEILPGASFCNACGTMVNAANDETTQAAPPAVGDSSECADTAPVCEDSDVANDTTSVPFSSTDAPAVERNVTADRQGLDTHNPFQTASDAPTITPAGFSVPEGGVDNTTKPNPPVKPLSTWGFFWRELVFCIPVIGLIMLFVFAFADGVNKNSRSFARARLIYALIFAIIAIVCGVLTYVFSENILNWLEELIRNIQTSI